MEGKGKEGSEEVVQKHLPRKCKHQSLVPQYLCNFRGWGSGVAAHLVNRTREISRGSLDQTSYLD